jgi:phage-related protein
MEYLEELHHSSNPKDYSLYEKIMVKLHLLANAGSTLGMPHVKFLQDKIWELRVKNERILYVTIIGNEIYLLHHFTKKTQKTPKNDLLLAIKRYKELVSEK